MKKTTLLSYLAFACEHGYVLKIEGISGKISKVFVDDFNDFKLFGRFALSNETMSFNYEKIVSCHFESQEAQQSFEKELGLKLYGDEAQNIEQRLTLFKDYYQKIILNRKEDAASESESETSKADLKKQAIERFETIIQQTLISPESLLFHYFLATPISVATTVDECPVLLLSRSNYSQKSAIERALNERISVIEGPPGTGKTTTILSIIANLVVRGNRIAVVSKNESAIDNIKDELENLHLPPFYIRLGNQKVMKTVNHSLKAFVDETIKCVESLSETSTDEQSLYRLYTQLKKIEADINALIKKKNQLQEDENMLRHMEKRRAAFGTGHELRRAKKFQNRGLDSMRREIDNIAYALQQLDYRGRYSIWSRLKNSFIWKMNRDEFESEGLLLQFQLEYLYLLREIGELTAELEQSKLVEKQTQLAELYDQEYIALSQQVLQKFLCQFFQNDIRKEAAKQINECMDKKPYNRCKNAVRELYPVVLTTADALVYNFSDYMRGKDKFDYIIVDEASQCDLITGIPVLHLAERCVIVGDQKQLSAITNETAETLPEIGAAYNYFAENLLSSIQKVWKMEPTLLREHYRCDYAIINYCNKFYYNGELIIYTEASDDAMRLLRVDQGKYMHDDNFCNEREIRAIEGVTGPTLEKTYVITPFKNQGEQLRSHFHCGKDVCGTIHTFQGRGQETVFFSTVLNDLPVANTHLAGSHCLFKKELLNVAVSRAKNCFVLVSDAAYLRKKNKEMRNLIDYIESYGREIPDKTVCLFDGLYRKMRSYVKHDDLDNPFEESLYRSIEAYCQKHPQTYCRTKLPLANLVTDKVYLEQNPEIRNFVLHHNTHVDFTLCNAVDNPVLAIELDGRHHNKPEQKVRDEKKNAALQHMQIPLLRISSKAALTADEFEEMVDALLGYQNSSRNH